MLNVDFFSDFSFFLYIKYVIIEVMRKKSNKQQQKWEKIWDYFCQHT